MRDRSRHGWLGSLIAATMLPLWSLMLKRQTADLHPPDLRRVGERALRSPRIRRGGRDRHPTRADRDTGDRLQSKHAASRHESGSPEPVRAFAPRAPEPNDEGPDHRIRIRP